MIVSTTTSDLLGKHGVEGAIRLIAEAGFDAYDYSFCSIKSDNPFFTDSYMDYAKKIKALSEECGITCNQAHAPFPSSVGDPEKDEKIFNDIVKSMEFAAYLGAHVIVVHPKQHLCYQEHVDELYEMNVEFYNRLMPYAEKFGIKVATENMWQWNSSAEAITDSTCSRAWEFNKYIDAINSPYLVGCLDIGHASLMGTSIPDFIHQMGKEHIYCLHVHDTNFKEDNHTLPYTLKINWAEVAKALGEIGYEGDFTFESGFASKFPKELSLEAETLQCKVGRYLAAKIEEHRA